MVKFKIDNLDKVSILSVSGEMLDRYNTIDLKLKMDESFSEGKRLWVINLQSLKYLNSEGLGILVSLFTKARNMGGEVVLSNVSEELQKLFIMTKLNKIFRIEDNQETAIEFLKSIEKES